MIRPEALFGPPMAAPETSRMRRLRIGFIALAALSGLLILGIDFVSGAIGRVATGGLMLVVLTLTTVVGAVFFWIKSRRDDRWIESRGFDREGEGA